MSFETAKATFDMSVNAGSPSTGFCFYGGEPLLNKKVIIDLVNYIKENKPPKHKVGYKLVTNGTLLDEEFIKFATDNKIDIALSFDGSMQDSCRVYIDGTGSSKIVLPKIEMLLKYQPRAVVMVTVDPTCVTEFANSMEQLFNMGFRVLLATPRFDRDCPWDDDTLELLGREYDKISDLYIKWSNEGHQFYFGPYDSKISAYINGDEKMRRLCEIGDKQPSVLPDGKIYPCQQFIEDEYCMGNVFDGINLSKLNEIRQMRSHKPTICLECDYKDQCRYTCCCLNYQCTGAVDEVSPFQCEHERLVIDNANRVASVLYENRTEIFLKKQYKSTLRAMTEGLGT